MPAEPGVGRSKACADAGAASASAAAVSTRNPLMRATYSPPLRSGNQAIDIGSFVGCNRASGARQSVMRTRWGCVSTSEEGKLLVVKPGHRALRACAAVALALSLSAMAPALSRAAPPQPTTDAG